MATISRLLEELPDEASRLRVMRWAFGKYGEEFKRPAPGPVVAARSATVMLAPRAGEPVDIQPPDFDRQVAELNDLFGDRPDGLRLAKPRNE